MRKQEQKDTIIKILNGSGITVNDEQDVVKEVERCWGNLFCTNGKMDCRIPESTGSRRSRETKRLDESNIEWSRYPEIVERE